MVAKFRNSQLNRNSAPILVRQIGILDHNCVMFLNEMYPCESFARFALPTFRLLVARDLIEKHGFTQTEAARRLGITQSAISQYVHSKRGLRAVARFEEEKDMIERAVDEIAEDIAGSEKRAEEISESFCKLCLVLREKGKVG